MRYFLIASIMIFLYSCKQPEKEPQLNLIEEKIRLLEADKAFSRMSEMKGMKTAFIEYIDSNGVLLRPGYMPITGANAIDFLIQQNDTSFIFTWQPHNAVVSVSADMGYTYGIYSIKPRSADTSYYGTYVSIWKKQHDGSWKFVLDSGNEGIGDY